MRIPMNANISFKLPALITVMVTIAVGVASAIAYYTQRNSLLKAAEEMLIAQANSRSELIEHMLEANAADLSVTARSSLVARSIKGFTRAWSNMEQGQTEALQKAYIDDNPHERGQRHRLLKAEDGSIWSSVHAQMHADFLAIMNEHGYYDVMLIDPIGNVLYTVGKERDFATNLNTGEWRDTGLAKAFRAAIELPENQFTLEDYDPYSPSFNEPAAFMAQSVFAENGDRIGVVVYQFNSEHISSITKLEAGLGETGDIFVVGPDHLLRSNSRFADQEMVMLKELDNSAVLAALNGQSGVVESVGLSGNAVISAYAPLSVFGQTYALIAEQDRDEVFADANMLLLLLVGSSTLVVLIISALGLVFARSLTQPLKRAAASLETIYAGSYEAVISDTVRQDEIGVITRTLEKIQTTLAHGEEEAYQNHFSSVAFNSASSATMMADKDMKITSINPALKTTLLKHSREFGKMYPDFDPENVVNTDMDFYHPPELRERVRELLRDPANLPHTASIGIGDSRFSLNIAMVQSENDECMGYIVEWLDVTEEYLRDAVLNSINTNQVKAEFSMENTLVTANDLFCMLTGLDLQSIQGKTAGEIFSFDREKAAERGNICDRLKAGETIFDRFDVPNADDKIAVVEGGFSLVSDASGKPIRILFLGLDVTEARRAIEEAEAERTQMVAAQDLVVENLRNGLRLLSEGDLTVNIDVEFDEEHEQLRHDFNTTGVQLLGAMQGVVENADLIRGEASEIANAAEDLSARTERQAATLEETASALDQLTSSVRSAADGAARANEIVENARDNAEASGEVVREAVGAMSEIENSSKQISKITGVIDDIAFQTNLLALNAGVEAARAGEAGRGFAVVASEVRALAQRSSDAAREINELISASGGQVKRGVELVDQTGKALAEIVKSVSEINNSVSEIAVSSREQSSGLAEINEAVNQLDQVTQQNAAMFEETTAASHALTREAETLTETMGQFKIGSGNSPETDEDNVVSTETFTTRRQPVPPVKASGAETSNTALAVEQNAVEEDDIEDDWDDF